MLACFVLLFVFVVYNSEAVPIDNGVEGMPSVSCGMDSIHVLVNTQKPFLGRIFVKGMSKRKDCFKEFNNNSVSEGGLKLHLSACGMKRERKLSPSPGLEESITIVVSFHYVFITKVDKAYKILCSYSQDSFAFVTHGLNVSMIPTERLSPAVGVSRPVCSYEIHRDSRDGPLALYAEIGDPLYHVWECKAGAGGKILVKNCYVTDGIEESFYVIDDRGCAVDPVVLQDLRYAEENSAWVEAHAFRFADSTFVGFSCTIQMCLPGEDCLDLSPPACSIGAVVRNGSPEERPAPTGDEVDVSTPPLNVLDSAIYFDPQPSSRLNARIFNIVRQSDAERSVGSVRFPDFVPHADGAEIDRIQHGKQFACVSKFHFGIIILGAVGVLFTMFVAIAALSFKIMRAKTVIH